LRILGLDMGSKRIGVAVSDELGITAQGVETIIRKNPESDLEHICRLVGHYNAEEIVVGLPLNMDGSEGPQARTVRQVIQQIAERSKVPVLEWDERLSTVAAERPLLEADMSRASAARSSTRLQP
jgi:putative holliday junction resolvase